MPTQAQLKKVQAENRRLRAAVADIRVLLVEVEQHAFDSARVIAQGARLWRKELGKTLGRGSK